MDLTNRQFETTPFSAPPQEKYRLEKKVEENLELKIFFISILTTPMVPPNLLKQVGIVAYRHSEAMKKAQEVYGMNIGGMVVGKPEDYESMKNLLQYVDLEIQPPNVTPIPDATVMPIERFKTSLIMATAEYIKDEKDRMELRRIIQTIPTP